MANNELLLGAGSPAAGNSSMPNSLPVLSIDDPEFLRNINGLNQSALTTRQSIAISALSLANHPNRAVLKILPG
jgi:hypothetical protein